MTRPNRLHVVSKLRKLRERQAQGDLAAVQVRFDQARRNLDKMREPSYDGHGPNLNAAQLIALRAQGIVRSEDLVVAQDAWAKCESELRHAMSAVRSATSKRKASDELIDKRRLANAAVAAKASQAALDEVVVMRHAREASRQ